MSNCRRWQWKMIKIAFKWTFSAISDRSGMKEFSVLSFELAAQLKLKIWKPN
jgi:hypothetical protein